MTALAPGQVAAELARLRDAHMDQLAGFIEENIVSDSGVIPPPQDRSPMVRVLGSVEDMDGSKVHIGVDHDTVTVSNAIDSAFTQSMAEEFAHLFAAACWAAGQNQQRMTQEVT